MSNQYPIYLLLCFLIVAANLPWLSNKLFAIISLKNKPAWIRGLEWLVLYVLSFGLGFALEYKVMGTITTQAWEFYVVALCLFAVFALPGFIYHHELKKIFRSA